MSDLNFIYVPTRIVNQSGVTEYIWDGLDVRITEKGRSVFAIKVIEKETLIPYGGHEIFGDRYSEVCKIDKDCQWIVAGKKTGVSADSEIITWLDANPKNYPERAPKNAWIGSLVNLPSIGESANCRLVDFDEKEIIISRNIPSYPFVPKWPKTFVAVEVWPNNIQPGDELLSLYGWDVEITAARLGPQIRKAETLYDRYYQARSETTKTSNAIKRIRKQIVDEKLARAREVKKRLRDKDNC
jgi:hypothetical protein